MRTTFSIDPDIVPKLKALVRRKKDPMRKVLNDLIRVAIGLEHSESPRGFEVKSEDLGLKAGYDAVGFNSLYDDLELEAMDTRREKKRR